MALSRLSKIKIAIVLSFLIMLTFIYKSSTDTLDAYLQSLYQKELETLRGNYQLSSSMHKVIADGLYNFIITQESILSLINEAKNTQDLEKREKLRKELYEMLRPYYEEMQQHGLNIILFSFEDNSVFLRVHKPSKHSDDISQVRKIVADVNKERQTIRGFEQGKISHAFRNAYPLYYNEIFLGSVDISFSSEYLQKQISDIYNTYTHFLVKKSLFETIEWSGPRNVSYIQSAEHKEYLYTVANFHATKKQTLFYNELAKSLQSRIAQGIQSKKSFAMNVNKQGSSYILAFMPIQKYKSEEVAAYVVSYTQNHDLYIAEQSYYLVNIALFSILSFLTLTLLYIIRQKESLKKEVRKKTKELEKMLNSFDKNVIYSTTDNYGFITHVSDAFCEISGYSKEELIGQPHSIVRHADMPKSLFQTIWSALKRDGYWSGEIKNRRKDGSYYWVYSKIQREYDEDNEPIGYYAVREDITSKKEVEELKSELENFNKQLESEVIERTREIVALNNEIIETQVEVINTMGAIGETRSKETGQHVERVAEYSYLLAKLSGLSEEEALLLKQASPMHDIGKVGIPDNILNKPAKHTPEEFEIMKTHAMIGYEMLRHSKRPILQASAEVALTHHEKYDGSGYPKGLKGEDIPIYGRITAIADVFDALGHDRCYKKAWELEKILELFQEQSGKHFDPKLIKLFFDNLSLFLETQKRFDKD